MTGKTVQVSKLEAQSEKVFQLLREHDVLRGGSGKWLEAKENGFKSVVKAHALGWIGNQSLILSYPTCVRLVIDTEIIDGEAVYVHAEAIPYPAVNSSINYEALNTALKAVISN